MKRGTLWIVFVALCSLANAACSSSSPNQALLSQLQQRPRLWQPARWVTLLPPWPMTLQTAE